MSYAYIYNAHFKFYSYFLPYILVSYFKYNSVYRPSQTHSLSISLPPIMVTTSSLSKSVSLLLFFERVEKEELLGHLSPECNCVQY